MTLPLHELPALDGTREATDARLGSWVRAADDFGLEDALYGARASLDEASGVMRGFAAAEECSDEACSKAGDVEYLGEQLGEARAALAAVETAAGDIVDQAARRAVGVA